jgi:hypothetical protein
MNGQWLGTRKIRTNWATRKAPTNETASNTRHRGMYKRSVDAEINRCFVKMNDIHTSVD